MLGDVIKNMKMATAESLEGQILKRIDTHHARRREKMTATSLVRVSSISRICPRDEVHYALSKDFQSENLGAKNITFNFGEAFQDVIRDRYLAKMGVLIGHWKCGKCKKVQTLESDGYVKAPSLACACGSIDFSYIEPEFIDKTHGIIGHADGFLHIGHRYSLLEIKTCNDNSFKMFKKMKFSAPYMEDYITQIQSYMWLSKYDNGTFLFFNKNSSEMFSLPIEYNRMIVDHALQKVSDVRKGIEMKTLPRCYCKDSCHDSLVLDAA